MKQTLEVLNKMEAEGVIGRHAVSGAIAALNYLEPTITHDLDILVTLGMKAGLIDLRPIFSYLKKLGYEAHQNEGIVIGGWPVQFIPVSDALDAEALAEAQEKEINFPLEGNVKTRILKPEHLVAIALRTGRPKDYIRISQFVDSGVLDYSRLCSLLKKHNLETTWITFCKRTNMANPCKTAAR